MLNLYTLFSFHDDGTMLVDPTGVAHRLVVTSVKEILRTALLIESLDDLTDAVWLSTPMQTLLELTSGEVFVDDIGEITRMRKSLSFYPDPLWRYQLAGLWMRVGQIQPFIGRSGEVGDELGTATITASIARDLMRIGLLQSRRYAPYSKWLGTALARIDYGQELSARLQSALVATDWHGREGGINAAGSMLIEQLNQLELISPSEPVAEQFHSRPFHVLPAEKIASALRETLHGTGLTDLQATMGGIDIVTDSTDVLGSHEFRLAVRSMFTSESES